MGIHLSAPDYEPVRETQIVIQPCFPADSQREASPAVADSISSVLLMSDNEGPFREEGLKGALDSQGREEESSREKPRFETDSERLQWQIMDLYESLQGSLMGYLRGNGLSVEQADDVIQESFLRLVSHLQLGGRDENLRAWLFRVARNLSTDVHRAGKRLQSLEDSDGEQAFDPADLRSDPEAEFIENEEIVRVGRLMASLTPRQRQSVLLRAQGLTLAEIGTVLGVSVPGALHLIRRGLKRLAGGS